MSRISGVGRTIANRLSALGIITIRDLLYYFPRRYLDRSSVTPIAQVKTAQDVTVVGRVKAVEIRKSRRGKSVLEVTIFDGTGYITGVWFNQDYHKERLKEGAEVAFSGKVQYEYRMLQIVNPSYDILASEVAADAGTIREAIHTGRIVPVYSGSAHISSAMLRRIIKNALDMTLDNIEDPLPHWILKDFGLLPLSTALSEAHFPTSAESLKKAIFRALFDEVFTMQVGLALIKKRREIERKGVSHKAKGELPRKLLSRLEITLTSAQKRAFSEIANDMRSPVQMNRLLQGEVASGKTIVALLAILLCVESGFQAAMMTPTEVLANQHYARISALLDGLPVRVALLTGSSDKSLQEDIASGLIDLVIGTHALIQEKVSFEKLGLVVVDEQHRFGLEQRQKLASKGNNPDILYLSATPIPRTLALTLYGDLDVSVLDEVPTGRKEVVTIVADSSQRQGALALVRKEVSDGKRAFVVCPLIEESRMLEAKAASVEARRLKKEFPEFRIGLLHGQMKSDEKKKIMEKFQEGEIDILITTSMVEVGIDVPEATVMIVESADRFGLSQLHQLRGRVGRGKDRGVCVLFADPKTEEAKERLRAIKDCHDGFSLAEADLRIRGEGSLFGTRQSGLPDLKFVRLARDYKLIKSARLCAFKIIDNDPRLSLPENAALKKETARRFGKTLEWLFKA